MSRRPVLFAFVAAGLILSSTTARAETLQLRNGQALQGDVQLEGADGVVIDVRFPDVKTVRLTRGELTPESLFAVLERRTDAKDF